MDLQINFLTEDSLKMQICEAYWMQAGDGTFVFKVKEIADKYGLQYQGFSKLISQWCQAYSSEDACSECGERFWVFKSRSEYKSRKSSRSAWICSSCRRKKQEEVKQRQASQRTVLLNYYENVGDGVVNVEDIDDRPTTTLKNVVTLLSIIRLTATEDLSHIRPLHTLGDGRLSPTPKYDLDLLKGLTESRVLMPDVTHSSLDAFVFEENNSFSGSYYIFYVAYGFPVISKSELLIDEPREMMGFLEHLFLEMEWPDSWYEQWIPLWKEVALNECLQYLDLCMREHSFDFSAGEKTRQTLENALSTFSTAQVFNFIWGSARNAAAYYMRERIPKRRAANSVVGSIQRRADQARAEEWTVKAYRRDRRCPQTEFSRTLFDVVLHIGDEGFNKPPGE